MVGNTYLYLLYDYNTQCYETGMDMKVNKIIRRAIALRNARDRAKNDEFKKLWDKKLVQLILESER